MENFKEALIKALDDFLENKGASIRISKDILKTDHFVYIDFDDYKHEDSGLEFFVKPSAMDEMLLLYTLLGMLKIGEAEIIFNESATKKNINYLMKLTEAINKRVE